MKTVNRARWAVLALVASGVCAASGPVEYFCPRSNVWLWQSAATAASAMPGSGVLQLELQDCSKGRFLCVNGRLRVGDAEVGSFTLAAPKSIRPRKELHFRDLRILTRPTHDLRKPDAPGLATLTLWQVSSPAAPPLELTVESMRGVVYLDGIRLSPDGDAETCILQTERGLLSDAKVR